MNKVIPISIESDNFRSMWILIGKIQLAVHCFDISYVWPSCPQSSWYIYIYIYALGNCACPGDHTQLHIIYQLQLYYRYISPPCQTSIARPTDTTVTVEAARDPIAGNTSTIAASIESIITKTSRVLGALQRVKPRSGRNEISCWKRKKKKQNGSRSRKRKRAGERNLQRTERSNNGM